MSSLDARIGPAPGERPRATGGRPSEALPRPAVPIPGLPPLRILHLVPEFSLGGMEQGIVKVVNGLDPSQIASSICSFAPGDAIRERLSPEIPVHVLERREGNDPRLVWRLFQLLRRTRPDIVHSHSWGTLCEGYLTSRLAGIDCFVHGEHGTMELRPRNLRVQRWVWSRADAVLSVSSNLADKMAKEARFPRQRVQVIRNGADLSRFGRNDREAARAELGLPSSAFVVGTVGRLAPVKDQAMLLTALSQLRRSDPDVYVVIAGDGALRSELEGLSERLGLRSAVRFAGNRRDVEHVLCALDVFALTSISEGLPNSIVEAMATGLPVVSTRVGGVDELVMEGETGLLVPPRSPEALAQALSTLRHDAGRRRSMAMAGQTRAQADFGLERMLEEYRQFYLQLTGRASDAPAATKQRNPACVES